jgi:hypothetical protein
VAARRIHALHQLTGADNADTDARRTDAGRSHRTPHPDTGHRTPDGRTPDTGHRTGGHRTGGHRTGGHRTGGHRTPDTGQADAGHADADAGRGQGDQGTVGIRVPRHRWDGEPCCCGWHARRSSTMTALGGEATCQRARLPATPPGSCWVAPPAAERRLGALLSLDDFGSSVERRGGGHPVYGDEWQCLQVLVGRRVSAGRGGAARTRGHDGQMWFLVRGGPAVPVAVALSDASCAAGVGAHDRLAALPLAGRHRQRPHAGLNHRGA